MKQEKFKVLFVCMGNICRSPTAEGVFLKRLAEQNLLERVEVDSAGTHNYHPNSPPDVRSQQHAFKRGYDISHLRARVVRKTDFEIFDLIITMDSENQTTLQSQCPPNWHYKLRGLTEFLITTKAKAIPDPYYGSEQDFELVLDLVQEASEGLLQYLLKYALPK